MTAARYPNGLEVRAAFELRAVSGRRLAGYAIKFGVPTKIGSFNEVVLRGAFAASLRDAKRDVLALADHAPDRVLARTDNGSLRLVEDSIGLGFELDVPPTTLGSDTLAMVEARLVGGVSIGFIAIEERWPARDRRELVRCDLHEISVVSAHPAYPETSISVRSRPSSALHRRRMLEAM